MNGFDGNLTQQQQETLEALIAKINASQYAPDLKQLPDSTRFLLRFLRATMKDKTTNRIFNLPLALECVSKTFAWRRLKNVDEIRTNVENNRFPPNFARYHNEIRPRIEWVDENSACLVSMERMGLFASNLKIAEFTEEEWELFFIYDFELGFHTMRQESEARKREISFTLNILDIAGLGFGVISRIKLFKLLNFMGADHYPEIAGPIVLFNVPFVFTKIFGMVKPMLDPDTVSKLVLETKFPIELVRKLLGGSDTVDDFIPVEFGGKSPQVLKRSIHAL